MVKVWMYPQFGPALTSLYPSFTSCLIGPPPYLRSTGGGCATATVENQLLADLMSLLLVAKAAGQHATNSPSPFVQTQSFLLCCYYMYYSWLIPLPMQCSRSTFLFEFCDVALMYGHLPPSYEVACELVN